MRPGLEEWSFWEQNDGSRPGEFHDIRWVRTGVLNKDGNMILKRVDKPIGFRSNHAETTYGIDEDA